MFPGAYNTSGPFSMVLESGPFAILPDRIETLASKLDGATLQIGLAMPDVPPGTRMPVVVQASPYFQPLEQVPFAAQRDQGGIARLIANLVPRGYVVALLPVRGTADQGGCMDLMGPDEAADLDQAITWLGTQEWSNGNIGMIGLSYDGSTPWRVAALGNPHLKTIVSIAGVPSMFDLAFHNGSAGYVAPLIVYSYYPYGTREDRSLQHRVEGAVCPSSWEGIAASVASMPTAEPDPLGYWAARNARPGVEASYHGSVLLAQGLMDWRAYPGLQYPWMSRLEEQGIVVKHLLGQWMHAYPDGNSDGDPTTNLHPRWDWAEITARWFDSWLAGKDVDLGPRAQVQDSSGLWRSEADWPPPDAQSLTFYLGAANELADAPGSDRGSFLLTPSPGAIDATLSYKYEPLMNDCPDCVQFVSEPLTRELRFAGLPQVHVTVTPLGPGGHVSAVLYAEKGNHLQRLGWGQIDLRFADGGTQAQPVVPGQPLLAQLELEPLDAVVPAGGRLVLGVGQASIAEHFPSVPTYPVQLDVGGDQSTLRVMAFARGAEAFFEPPMGPSIPPG